MFAFAEGVIIMKRKIHLAVLAVIAGAR